METPASPDDVQCTVPDSPDTSPDSVWTDFISDLISSCTDSVVKSNALPVLSDYTYYDAFPAFRSEIDTLKSTLLSSMKQLIDVVDKDNDFRQARNEVDRFRCLTEATDMVLERVDMIVHQKPMASNIVMKSTTETKAAKQSHRSLHARPQDDFKEPVDNSTSPWRPAFRNPLPNHHTSLIAGERDSVAPSPKLGPDMMSHIGSLGINTDKPPHPYKSELEHLAFAEDRLRPRAEKIYQSLEETEYSWIDTEDGLRQLAEVLSNEQEFAVDLEHHNFRSYLGFTCLMQISTRSHDYIIDTLQLRHSMHLLLDPFTNPAIVKVFHGADYDVCWLQKDFSLFVVNMFDTGQAARVLQLQSFSLKHLLDHYCDVQTCKVFQRADWRLRPIPAPMIKYARSDTHYLLFIYDRMSNQLCEQSTGVLLSVYEKSRKICLKMFEKPSCNPQSYMKLIQQFELMLDRKQELALRNLYQWRDTIARELDESCGYVMPNAVLISICKAMPIDLKSIFDVVPNVSPPVRKGIAEVLSCITKAVEDSATESLTVQAVNTDPVPVISSQPKVFTLDEPLLPPPEQPISSESSKSEPAVSVELACRSSSRMFDSDSDDDCVVEDTQASEAIKMRIFQALNLKPTTASNLASVAPKLSELQQDDLTGREDTLAKSESVILPKANESGQTATEEEDEPGQTATGEETEPGQTTMLADGVCDEKDSSMSLNEMRFGRKRKPQQQAVQSSSTATNSSAVPFDYQKAIESAANSDNDSEAKKSFDFFRGPMIKRKKHNFKRK